VQPVVICFGIEVAVQEIVFANSSGLKLILMLIVLIITIKACHDHRLEDMKM